MREFREVSIDLIDESDNIRRSFSEEKLRELSASIRQRGVLKPILVRPNGERFKLIDGWRRLSAAKAGGVRTIPVRVRDIDENAAEEEMIIANLHHEDVTPLDERKRQEAQWARQREAAERWRTQLRPRALQLIASRTAKLPWSRGLIATLLEELNIDGVFTELVGRPQGLPTKRYPQAIAVALALRRSWRREDLVKFARRFGVRLTAKDLRDGDHPTNDNRGSEPQTVESPEASVH